MPLYDYRCKACQAEIEVLARHDDPPPRCRRCGGEMRKLPSLASFRLEGRGWARDGYSKD